MYILILKLTFSEIFQQISNVFQQSENVAKDRGTLRGNLINDTSSYWKNVNMYAMMHN